MFFEFETVKKEKIALNLQHILFITPGKQNGAVIVDTLGMDYKTNESYEDVLHRLKHLEFFKTWQNV